jgi:hypothetical protein
MFATVSSAFAERLTNTLPVACLVASNVGQNMSKCWPTFMAYEWLRLLTGPILFLCWSQCILNTREVVKALCYRPEGCDSIPDEVIFKFI